MDERRETSKQDDGAVFAPTAIRARSRPPILVAGLALTIGAFAVFGVFDGLAGRASTADASPPIAAAVVPKPTRTPRPSRPEPAFVPPPTLPTTLVELDLRPAGSHLFVHGEVFSLDVIVVTVSIEDAAGHVSDVRSVRLQGGSRAFWTAPNARFDVRFDVPDEVMGEGLWVKANAYDFSGRTIETVRRPVLHPALGAFGGQAGSGGAT